MIAYALGKLRSKESFMKGAYWGAFMMHNPSVVVQYLQKIPKPPVTRKEVLRAGKGTFREPKPLKHGKSNGKQHGIFNVRWVYVGVSWPLCYFLTCSAREFALSSSGSSFKASLIEELRGLSFPDLWTTREVRVGLEQ